ncbi:hypothetical protein LNA61_002015 [Staphylococcus pseudintermedius]|nr:hypothetical protein [Staphylococcus pseudintermedius]HEC2186097.1 hypothetical protein [Staphylococcus delphini]EGQ2917801.1 hypothetical protein [Staphylococcus pseudintermedius]EGQ3431540.1 hypothetical protein [Staphylococcus pseudintermedius]EGQ3438889.1 hypothetical protein [Staphylococcus pseudintermedius]
MKFTIACYYLKFNFLYFVQRKFEFIKNNNLKKMFKLLFFIQVMSSTFFLFLTSLIVSSYLRKYISIGVIEYYYFLISFIFIVLIPILPRAKILISPMDKDLLYRVGLKQSDIFNLIYLTDVLKKIPVYLSFIAIGLGISLNYQQPWILLFKTILSIIYFMSISYIIQIIYTNIKVKSNKKIVSISYFFINIILGIAVAIIGFAIAFLILNIFIGPFLIFSSHIIKIKEKFEWSNYLHSVKSQFFDIHSKTTVILDVISPHTIFIKINFYNVMWLSLMLLILVILYRCNLIGYWYRKEDVYNSYLNRDISLPNSLFFVQLKQLLSNREEINLHKPFFYISYSIWFFVGVIIYFSQFSSGQLANAMAFLMILNTVTRDSFSAGVDLFTRSLRFDSDGKSIGLYRISNTKFQRIYEAKISLIRFLGIKETFIIAILLSLFFNMDVYLYFLLIQITVINAIIIPNLSLLPSYLSPHFNYQHYSEFDYFEDQSILEDSLFDKIKNFLSASYFFIFFIGFLLQREYVDIMIFIITYNFLLFIILVYFTGFSKRKITKKWEKRDLYL